MELNGQWRSGRVAHLCACAHPVATDSLLLDVVGRTRTLRSFSGSCALVGDSIGLLSGGVILVSSCG